MEFGAEIACKSVYAEPLINYPATLNTVTGSLGLLAGETTTKSLDHTELDGPKRETRISGLLILSNLKRFSKSFSREEMSENKRLTINYKVA